MAHRVPKALLLLLVVAVAVFNRPADVTAMQLESNGDFGDEMESESASFSQIDADALADKLDADDEAEEMDEEDGFDEDDMDSPDDEAGSFLEGDEEVDEDIDLSQMSDEDAKAVMDMLSPEEQKAFQEMLEEHRNGDPGQDSEL